MSQRFHAATPPRRFRRRSHWAVMLGTALAASTTAGVQPAARPSGHEPGRSAGYAAPAIRARLQFQIPAGPLDGAVAEYERVTGLKVTWRIRGSASVQSSGAAGTLTPAAAMDAMLSGTSVRATFGGDGVRLDIRRRLGIRRRRGPAAEGERRRSTARALRDTGQTVVVIPQQRVPGAERDVASRGTAEYAWHHDEHRRRRQRRHLLGRQRADPRVQRAQRHLRRRRPRCRADQPRRVQHRSRGSGEGPVVGHDRPRIDRRIDQSRQQGRRTPRTFTSIRLGGGSADYKRTTLDTNQRLNNSVAFRFNAMWQDTGYAGRDVAKYKSWGLAPSLLLGMGKPTQLTLNFSHMQQNNVPDWGIPTLLPDVAINRGITVNDLNFSNFYGHRVARLRKHDVRPRHRDARSQVQPDAQPAQPDPIREELPRRRAHAATAGYIDGGPGPRTILATIRLIAQIRRTDTKYQYRNDRDHHEPDGSVVDVQDRGGPAQRQRRHRVHARRSADVRVHRLVCERTAAGRRSVQSHTVRRLQPVAT